MDTVIHLTAVERADSDICFQLEFRKARERTPENRADYQDVTIALANDEWASEIGISRDKPKGKELGVLEAFDNLKKDGKAVLREGQWAIKADDWQRECDRCGITNTKNEFRTYKSRLVTKRIIRCDGDWSWRT